MLCNRTTDRLRPGGCRRIAGWLAGTLVGLALIGLSGIIHPGPAFAAGAKTQEVVVYKSPTCGCCRGWVAYMRRHGFTVRVKNVDDLDPVKRMFGVTDKLAACHTATVGGYVVEGHVPVASVRKLLTERPKARGIAVPGMPAGTPGMGGEGSGPLGVLLFGADGAVKRYDAN
jgi:hypothetical protein